MTDKEELTTPSSEEIGHHNPHHHRGLFHKLGGAFTGEAHQLREKVSTDTLKLIDEVFEGLTGPVADFHCHVGGIGTGGTGCYMYNPPGIHPLHYIKKHVFATSCDVSDDSKMDQQVIERLVDLVSNIKKHYRWGKCRLLAMDKFHDENGIGHLDMTATYCPNEYTWSLIEKYPDLFEMAMSVHPYRKDAVEEVEKWAKKGVNLCKWLPNIMGIDPSSPKCDPFYEVLKKNNIALLSHTGLEKTLWGPGTQQSFGHPQLLRRALDKGVKVIAAHCGAKGQFHDMNDPLHAKKTCAELFLKMLDEEKYKDLLFGDVSGLISSHSLGKTLVSILERDDLHSRLVYGSDYPLPCVNVVIRTGKLAAKGYISEEQRKCLNEIYNYNPLLFDFVAKRICKCPKSGKRFAASVFAANPKLWGTN